MDCFLLSLQQIYLKYVAIAAAYFFLLILT